MVHIKYLKYIKACLYGYFLTDVSAPFSGSNVETKCFAPADNTVNCWVRHCSQRQLCISEFVRRYVPVHFPPVKTICRVDIVQIN